MKAGTGRKLVLAYGSNLHKASMRVRCPSAKPVGKLYLSQARLVFRSVADVEYCTDPEMRVPCGVWSITPEDERALDRYEGVSIGMYDRYHLRVGDEDALIYMMRDTGIAPPGAYYYDVIMKGYRDFGLEVKWLEGALRHSHLEKQMSPQIRRRREKNPSRHGNIVTLTEDVAIARLENRDRPVGKRAPIVTTERNKYKLQQEAAREASRKTIEQARKKFANHDPWAESRLLRNGKVV